MAKAKTPARPKLGVQPNKVTNAAKIRAIKSLLPTLPNPQGQLDSVVLSARTPFVANVAHCRFRWPFILDPDEDRVEYAAALPPKNPVDANRRPSLRVNLRVFHTNKAHLLTIYIDSEEDQSYSLTSEQQADDRQFFELPSGPQTILFAFLPTKSGQHGFTLEPVRPNGKGTARFYFFRVEFDVLT